MQRASTEQYFGFNFCVFTLKKFFDLLLAYVTKETTETLGKLLIEIEVFELTVFEQSWSFSLVESLDSFRACF